MMSEPRTADDRPEMLLASFQPSRWANELHREYSAYRERVPAAKCWLLLDPAIYDPADQLDIDPSLKEQCRPIAWQHTNLVPEHRPYFVELDLDTHAGDELLKASLHLAAGDWAPDASMHGAGHSICGWIFSCRDLTAAASHLGAMAVQARTLDSGTATRTLLRFWDPSTLPLLWEILDPLQRSVLLGPIDAWRIVDRFGTLRTFEASPSPKENSASREQLGLESRQWHAIQNIGAINGALIELASDRCDRSGSGINQIQASLMRARSAGINDLRDLQEYAKHAFLAAPHFDRHARVKEAIGNLPTMKYYRAVVGHFTTDDWDAIRQDCLENFAMFKELEKQNDT